MNKLELKKQIETLQAQYDAMTDEPVRLFDVADSNQEYNLINNCLGVESLTYYKDSFDKFFIKLGNHFTDKVEAERMAAFIRKNFLYWRMALKFADGYEWGRNQPNASVYHFNSLQQYVYSCDFVAKMPATVYMSEQNAEAFVAFCNKHKQELGL